MDGDSFADPRRRSTRGRGGRGGGRGASRGGAARGSAHGSARGSSRGLSRGRGGRGGGAKKSGLSQRKADELGSNAYRFQEREVNDDEDEFEVGLDIEEAAAGSMADDPYADAYKLDDDAIKGLFSVDLEGIEKALQSVPLWVRLGDVSRFALGVADDDVLENYLEPFDEAEGESNSEDAGQKGPGNDFAEALAGLNFDEEDIDLRSSPITMGAPASTELASNDDFTRDASVTRIAVANYSDGVASTAARQERAPVERADSTSRKDTKDDFDEWLDDV